MRKVIVSGRQSLFDIANQECGSVTAVFEIAQANNVSITDMLSPGTELKIPEAINKDIVSYFSGKNKKLATAIEIENDQQDQLLYVFPYILPMI